VVTKDGCRAYAIVLVQVQAGHTVAEPLQTAQAGYDALAEAAETAEAAAVGLPEALYPSIHSPVTKADEFEELAVLQQHTTQQKLAAVQLLVQWLLENNAEVSATMPSRLIDSNIGFHLLAAVLANKAVVSATCEIKPAINA
jgi:hypothetical protein